MMECSLAVQWLRLPASNAGDVGLIPGQGTKIPHAEQHSQKKKKERKNQKSVSRLPTLIACHLPKIHK